MALFVIGDLHLSFGCDKPMDLFPGWSGYTQKLEENWKNTLQDEDTIVLAGDTSWGMNFEESLADFQWLDNLPGQKILLKGNHDYWWNTASKMQAFFKENALYSLRILHNNSFAVPPFALCGTRSWMPQPGAEGDDKIMGREAGRLRLSLEYAQKNFSHLEKIVFLHYPPVYPDVVFEDMMALMQLYEVKRCYFGHLHGSAISHCPQGQIQNIQCKLISADALAFQPWEVKVDLE